jgi:hypothetical protein
MSIRDIFSNERDRYVNFLVETSTKLREAEPKTVGELLVSINNEAIPYPYRYVRVDVMTSSPDGSPKPCEVRIGLDPSFEAKSFNFGGFVVEVRPFTWNSVQVLFNQPIKDTEKLDRWITGWLDVEDKNPVVPSGIRQAIHSFSPVEGQGNWWFLTGDFGTALADALIEFIECLAGQGMTRIVVRGGGGHV